MQRILAELYDVVLEGGVVDGMPIVESSAEFDLGSEFTLPCDDGALYKVVKGRGRRDEEAGTRGDALPVRIDVCQHIVANGARASLAPG